MHLLKRLVAMAAGGAASVALLPAGASAREMFATNVPAKEVAACADASDRSVCLLPLVERISPAIALSAALLQREVPTAALETALEKVGTTDRKTSELLAAIINADRKRQDWSALLVQTDGLTPTDRSLIYASVCTLGIDPLNAEKGPREVAWLESRKPTAALAQAVGDRWEHELSSKPAPDSRVVVALMACRIASDDHSGLDRALKSVPGSDARLRLMMLVAARRYDEALALATAATTADVTVAPILDRSFPPTLFQWVYLQRERLRLMQVARIDGRTDIADTAAHVILAAAVASDRPESKVADTGVPQALGWVILHDDKATAARWLDQLESVTRPGKPGWNIEDAVAVYRCWLAVGRDDRAQAYYASAPHVGEMEEVRLDADKVSGGKGGADKLDQADLFRLDLIAGVADQTFNRRLEHAASEKERYSILYHCAVPPQLFDAITPATPPLPLDVSARCARILAAEPASDPEGERNTHNELATADAKDANAQALLSQALPSAAKAADEFALDRDAGDKREAALVVASRASQADRLDLANEMLSIALGWWRDTPAPHVTLSTQEAALLFEVVAVDLHARGKL